MSRVFRSAVLMGTSSIVGIVLNFFCQAYLAFRFGAGTEMDAYVAAMTVPALLTSVCIPALSIVLIPMFVESAELRGMETAWQTASTILIATAATLLVLVAGLLIVAAPLVRYTVPGLDAATTSLSVALFRWLVPAAVVNIMAGALGALYQAQENFWPTAIAPLVSSALLLGLTIALAPTYGIRAIAMATMAGSVGQLTFVLPVLRGKNINGLDLGTADVRRIALLLAPLLIGGLFFRATVVADRIVASLLPRGSLSHLEYASRIAAVITTVFTTGVAAAVYPRMSAYAARRDLVKLRDALVGGQRLLMLFLFPALAVGWVLRVDLLRVVLERGHFGRPDTLAVAAIVSWFMLGVVGGALGVLQARVYYVLQDTWTPVLLGIVESAAYFAYLPLLADRYGAVGVGISNAIYMLSALVVNGVIVFRKLHAHGSSELLQSAARLGFPAVAAAAAAAAVIHRLINVPLRIITATVTAAVVYCALVFLIKAREIHMVRSLFTRGGAVDAA